jgi:hypothetical protein
VNISCDSAHNFSSYVKGRKVDAYHCIVVISNGVSRILFFLDPMNWLTNLITFEFSQPLQRLIGGTIHSTPKVEQIKMFVSGASKFFLLVAYWLVSYAFSL